MADLLALVCDVYCDFVTFPFGILGQVWYLIVSIPDLAVFLTLIHLTGMRLLRKKLKSLICKKSTQRRSYCTLNKHIYDNYTVAETIS